MLFLRGRRGGLLFGIKTAFKFLLFVVLVSLVAFSYNVDRSGLSGALYTPAASST